MNKSKRRVAKPPPVYFRWVHTLSRIQLTNNCHLRD
nr:MAG TPA: hypothetical protein [Caudoviricetes sp.]DAU10150.1 MAG TPA: hypothetical protein [Caudoviricetes sp.]